MTVIVQMNLTKKDRIVKIQMMKVIAHPQMKILKNNHQLKIK
jgi:hypothetical protein